MTTNSVTPAPPTTEPSDPVRSSTRPDGRYIVAEPVIVTVSGKHSIFHPAQRATAHLTVSFSGPEKDAAYQAAAHAIARLHAEVRTLHDPASGPVTWWAADQLRTSSHRPWNQEGKQLALVHTAAASLTVKFSDFQALGAWLGSAAESAGVKIDRIEWALTEAVRAQLTAKARVAAVSDARDKAAAYGDALGYPRVTPLAVADVGMLGDNVSAPAGMQAFAARAAVANGDGFALKPEDIEVSSAVDARFRADRA